MSDRADLTRSALHYYRTLNPGQLASKRTRIAIRLLAADTVSQERGELFLAPSLRRALEVVTK